MDRQNQQVELCASEGAEVRPRESARPVWDLDSDSWCENHHDQRAYQPARMICQYLWTRRDETTIDRPQVDRLHILAHRTRLGLYKFHTAGVYIWVRALYHRCRPYYAKSTGSHPNSEVKRHKAGLVLRWGTAWETPVLTAFLFFIIKLINSKRRWGTQIIIIEFCFSI